MSIDRGAAVKPVPEILCFIRHGDPKCEKCVTGMRAYFRWRAASRAEV